MSKSNNKDDYQPNGIFIVNKSQGPTSHDIVSKTRRFFNTRKVGHAGTLDPMATGVLVVGIGEGTKLISYLVGHSKKYRATIQLGEETDTLDAMGTVTKTHEISAQLSLEKIQEAAKSFLGTTDQQAPVVSAIKQNGVPLYKRARRGEEVSAPIRKVVVHEIKVHSFEENQIQLEIHCGKGFYVRSFARDLAKKLGTLGHLTQLERTQVGPFHIEQSHPDHLLFEKDKGTVVDTGQFLLPMEKGCAGMNQIMLSSEQEDHARHGRLISIDSTQESSYVDEEISPIALMNQKKQLIAFAERNGETLKVRRVFNYSKYTSECLQTGGI